MEEFLVDILQIKQKISLCTPLEVEKPTFFQQAVASPNHKDWMDAMKDKTDSMTRNMIWELVDLPPNVIYWKQVGF